MQLVARGTKAEKSRRVPAGHALPLINPPRGLRGAARLDNDRGRDNIVEKARDGLGRKAIWAMSDKETTNVRTREQGALAEV